MAPIYVPKDGDYAHWEVALAARYPLALSEMRWPSVPLGKPDTAPVGRWGIECGTGWRAVVERLLDRLEAAIAKEPADRRDDYRIVQIKEKFGFLVVYLASSGTPEMETAIREALEESVRTCDVCGAAGKREARDLGWWSARCPAHETWTPGGDAID